MFKRNTPSIMTSDKDKDKRILDASHIAMNVPPVIRPDMISKKHWVCVGVEDELENSAANKLAQACTNAQFSHGWSIEIPWNVKQEVTGSYQLAFNVSEIEGLTKNCYIGSCYLIVENLHRFAIASDGDSYWMIAGPKGFVEMVVNRSVGEQLEVFGKLVKVYSKSSNSMLFNRLKLVQEISVMALNN